MLIPIQAEYYALEGLGQLINTIGLVQEHYNPNLTVSTMLVTMFDKRTLLSREVFSEVKSHYPSIVLDTTIPRTVKISEAPSLGKTVISYDPRGMGASAYGEAALEIARRSPSVLAAIDAKEGRVTHDLKNHVWVKDWVRCSPHFPVSREQLMRNSSNWVLMSNPRRRQPTRKPLKRKLRLRQRRSNPIRAVLNNTVSLPLRFVLAKSSVRPFRP